MNKIGIVIGFCLCAGCHAMSSTRITTTHGKEQHWFEASRTNMILAIDRTSDGVRIHSNGHYVKRMASDNPYHSLTNAFCVTVGDGFDMAPDHHASARFVIHSIDDDGITVTYESQFDHRSFGKDLITRDVGQFRWLFEASK